MDKGSLGGLDIQELSKSTSLGNLNIINKNTIDNNSSNHLLLDD